MISEHTAEIDFQRWMKIKAKDFVPILAYLCHQSSTLSTMIYYGVLPSSVLHYSFIVKAVNSGDLSKLKYLDADIL